MVEAHTASKAALDHRVSHDPQQECSVALQDRPPPFHQELCAATRDKMLVGVSSARTEIGGAEKIKQKPVRFLYDSNKIGGECY